MDSEITWSSATTSRWILGAVVALWSLVIGPEFPGEWGSGEPATLAPKQGVLSGSGKPIPMRRLATRPPVTVDRDAFLASYRRQARSLLNTCLQSWKPSPGFATFSAVLHRKSGRLSNLEALGEQASVPECVAKITGTMDFAPVAESMDGEQVILQWTAEW